MVMMENDDKLLTSFFAEHRQEIADNGFSRRVLRHLPDRSRHLAQIWTAFCFTLALVPVSYTHLDVYKRQGQGNVFARLGLW